MMNYDVEPILTGMDHLNILFREVPAQPFCPYLRFVVSTQHVHMCACNFIMDL